MRSLNESFTMLYVGLIVAVYLRPEYAINGSRTITIILLLSIVAISKFVYRMFLYPQYFTPLKGIPAPSERHWLKGNAHSILIETPHELISRWAKSIPHDGLLRYYIVGQLERVVLTNPKAMSEVLVTKAYDFVKPRIVHQTMGRIIGNGILLAEGDVHKSQRKNLMPAFAYRHIKDLYPVFWEKSREMAKLMRRDLAARGPTEDNVIQLRTYASRTTLDIIGLAGMGHDFDSLANPDNTLYKSYKALFTDQNLLSRILFMFGVLIGDMRPIQRLPTKRNNVINESRAAVCQVVRQMIREKKAKMEDPTADIGVDIISVAMRSGSFEEDNLIDQLMTFLAAGHETTAGALQWCVYALCKHPEVQDRLREEVRSNLPPMNVDNPEPIEASAIDNLPYLNAVCNEVLRFHPSVPNTVRIAAKDTTVLGQHIPKGTFFVISAELLNHMSELWGPDADKFNPDRWMGPGNAKTGGAISNYAFLTFLHGPHSCIGQSFSRAELACLLAAVVGSFNFELQNPDAKIKVRRGATVSPLDGVMAKLTPVDGW
ncbi:CTP synthase [Penicillium angulare]|uniref:CTP synthase n=1 Tax=Penicillium angulare TaxID=116970 RepID=UPI0025417652|nr:CTP synthase [Penicillium angulare]KAJ5287371.1 CTP synthase [Penicillium angulare]